MNRSKRISTRVLSTALTLAFAVIIAAAFYLTRQPVPVTGPAAAAQAEPVANRSSDLGAGYVLEINNGAGRIIAPAVHLKAQPASPAISRLDIGSGYWLEMNGMEGQIVPPAARPSISRMDLGAGFTLETVDGAGRIVAPAAVVKAQPASHAISRLDLGAGHFLELVDGTGRIVAPALHAQPASGLVQAVRQGTERYKDVEAAKADGHGEFLGCVSGQQSGAMGVHYPNGSLVGDGALDPMHPEVMIYEVKNGRYELVGVEFLVLVEDWHENNAAPPVLLGQVFHYNGSPNRYGMPAFYELHVWAWKHNPNGMFADWNPNVSCEGHN